MRSMGPCLKLSCQEVGTMEGSGAACAEGARRFAEPVRAAVARMRDARMLGRIGTSAIMSYHTKGECTLWGGRGQERALNRRGGETANRRRGEGRNGESAEGGRGDCRYGRMGFMIELIE